VTLAATVLHRGRAYFGQYDGADALHLIKRDPESPTPGIN